MKNEIENKQEKYFAHIYGDRKQTIEEHLEETAAMSSEFAGEFGASNYGYLAGISHDIGKYSDEFQRRLFGGPKANHSFAGALECVFVNQILVGMCVSGHHGGLPDYGSLTDCAGDNTFIGKLRRDEGLRALYSNWAGNLPTFPEPSPGKNDFEISLWVRMLYSCLVDADFLNTEYFMKNGNVFRGNYDSISDLLKKLNIFTKKWDKPKREIDIIRNKIRADCIKASFNSKGIFTLTVPTGGGKTVSSLAFGLRHANIHNMKRIIYVIPYTSIIEQSSDVFGNILGVDNVVEHHFDVDIADQEEATDKQKRMLCAMENWDAPIIVTTAVQFFESFFSNKPSKCRKLHNVANSVIIFDEVQSIPTGYLKPCMATIGALVENFGVTAVLCSATQPFVSDILKEYAPDYTIKEICQDTDETFEKLKRVKYVDKGEMTIDDLAAQIKDKHQVLCVVNTRKIAKKLFDILQEDGCYHLSTFMTPDHRQKTLFEIRKRLAKGETCRVVSTSLIEAGIDIDFPAVYRERTGLDSIVQAGGRCNREGKQPWQDSVVTMFSLDSKVPQIISSNVGATNEALQGKTDIGTRESVKRYFKSYRDLIGEKI